MPAVLGRFSMQSALITYKNLRLWNEEMVSVEYSFLWVFILLNPLGCNSFIFLIMEILWNNIA